MERGEIPTAPIFLDSPLAIRATEVFRKHAASLDQVSMSAACSIRRISGSPKPWTKASRLRNSQASTSSSPPAACATPAASGTISSVGYGTRATVLLVGFQPNGTLGRFLQDGAKAVRIQGDEIKVAARIRMIDDYSGHADGSELARWIAARRPIRRGVFLVHGEEQAIAGLAERVAERIIPTAMLFQPVLDDVYELSTPAPTLIEDAPSPSAHATGGDQSGLAQ